MTDGMKIYITGNQEDIEKFFEQASEQDESNEEKNNDTEETVSFGWFSHSGKEVEEPVNDGDQCLHNDLNCECNLTGEDEEVFMIDQEDYYGYCYDAMRVENGSDSSNNYDLEDMAIDVYNKAKKRNDMQMMHDATRLLFQIRMG